MSSNGNIANSNCVCSNSKYDFALSGATGSGDKNTCSKPDGWKDSSVSSGCKYACSGACLITKNVTFSYRVRDDNPLINCSLWTDISGSWGLEQTRTDIVNDAVNTFEVANVPIGAYKWSVNCVDGANQTVGPTAPPEGYLTFSVSLCA